MEFRVSGFEFRENASEAMCIVILVPNQPHQPAAAEEAQGEPGKAFEAVAHHLARLAFLSDAENHRGEDGEEQRGGKVRELDHDFFPIAIWCASTALMTLSSPATIMNLVP